jgi:type IX secretion system PorP/SprF family membrane protein
MKKIIVGLFLMLGVCKSYAQQDPQYSQYMFNGLVINPAYAGNKQVLNVNADYRAQWTGIQGAPTTQTLSIDGVLPDPKSSVGFHLVNDKIGAQGLFSAVGSYAYRIKLKKGSSSSLSFGLSAALSQYTLNGNEIATNDKDDPSIPDYKSSKFAPDARFGLYYSKENAYLGFSISGLLGSKITFSSLSKSTSIVQSRHYYLTGGYIFDLTDAIKFYPSVMLKEDFRAPTSYDINALFLFNNTLWVGAAYRGNAQVFKSNLIDNLRKTNVIGLLLSVNVNKNIRVGYSFDYSLSALTSYDTGSHEITLAYLFNGSRLQRVLSPRYF